MSAAIEATRPSNAALDVGIAAIPFLRLTPAMWVELADGAGMHPTYCPRYREQRDGMITYIPDDPDQRRRAEFLNGWLNAQRPKMLGPIIDHLRQRGGLGNSGGPLEVPAAVRRACSDQFRFVSSLRREAGCVPLYIPNRLAERLMGWSRGELGDGRPNRRRAFRKAEAQRKRALAPAGES